MKQDRLRLAFWMEKINLVSLIKIMGLKYFKGHKVFKPENFNIGKTKLRNKV